MWVLIVALIVVYATAKAIVEGLEARSVRHFEDMDSVRDSMNYQAYLEALKAIDATVFVMPPFDFEGFEPRDNTVTRTDSDGLVRVDPITDVRTHRPTPVAAPRPGERSRDPWPDDYGIRRPRPIKDNPQA